MREETELEEQVKTIGWSSSCHEKDHQMLLNLWEERAGERSLIYSSVSLSQLEVEMLVPGGEGECGFGSIAQILEPRARSGEPAVIWVMKGEIGVWMGASSEDIKGEKETKARRLEDTNKYEGISRREAREAEFNWAGM